MGNKTIVFGAGLSAVLLLSAVVLAQGIGQHGHGHGQAQMHQNHQHDMARMPGLQGRDTTAEEVGDMAAMFRNHPSLARQVTLLPNGIRTETSTPDPALRDALLRHVIGMIDRVDTGRDPKVRIQSPTLDIIFARRAQIETQIDLTDTGIVVVQTSTDPEVVAALQTHAAEISDMAARGMHAVHEAMARRMQQ